MGRTCGECNACCKVFKVPEVGKNDGGWCQHCSIGKGCTIYNDRPLACRLFACTWINGMGDAAFRPDRLGVMVDVYDLQLGERTVGEVHFYEMRPGALEQPSIRRMAEQNKGIGFVITLHRILTDTSYLVESMMAKRFFTEAEAAMLIRRS